MVNKWIDYKEWKAMQDWQLRKEIDLLPPWMVYFLYNTAMNEIWSKMDLVQFLTKNPTIKINKEYQWDILNETNKT